MSSVTSPPNGVQRLSRVLGQNLQFPLFSGPEYCARRWTKSVGNGSQPFLPPVRQFRLGSWWGYIGNLATGDSVISTTSNRPSSPARHSPPANTGQKSEARQHRQGGRLGHGRGRVANGPRTYEGRRIGDDRLDGCQWLARRFFAKRKCG